MPKHKPIWIICPQHLKRVRGWYEAGPDGAFRYTPGGEYVLDDVRCTHDGGRCMQTLCVLHRYNRRGPESWYPERILAMPDGPPRSPPQQGDKDADLA